MNNSLTTSLLNVETVLWIYLCLIPTNLPDERSCLNVKHVREYTPIRNETRMSKWFILRVIENNVQEITV